MVVAFILIITALHTYFLSIVSIGYFYFYIREVFVISFSMFFCIYHGRLSLIEKRFFIIHLILSNIFIVIALIHLLKNIFGVSLEFGGILC